MKNQFPLFLKPVRWFLKKIAFTEDKSSLIGDIEENFFEILSLKGKFAASLWYMGQILVSIFPFIINLFKWSLTMFINYFKTYFWQFKSYDLSYCGNNSYIL